MKKIFAMNPSHQNRHHQSSPTPLFRFDGVVPAWGVFLFIFGIGLSWATYSWNRIQDVGDRLTISETKAHEYNKRVELVELQQRNDALFLNRIGSDLQVVKELLLRLEKRFEKNPQ